MPWKETERVKERLDFIKAVDVEVETTFRELCARYGISTKTGYKWLSRYESSGPAGLTDRPSTAATHPQATDIETVAFITTLRKSHPTWGPVKLVERLRRMHPEKKWPAPSTVGDILKRQGLIRPRRRRQLSRPPVLPSPRPNLPNDVWAMDFKGHFKLGNGERCHPFTLTDEASRSLLCCHGAHTETDAVVRPLLEQSFNAYGLPAYIRSDNGNPFATRTIGGLSRLIIWLIQLGVTPVRIEPGKPQQNGKHERFHLTLKQDVPVMQDFAEQQQAFDSFRHIYNEERPHQALSGATPWDVYRVSPRRPGLLREPEYDSTQAVRRVDIKGVIDWKGDQITAGTHLVRQPVGIREVADGIVEVRYGPIVLGYFDEAAPARKLRSELPDRRRNPSPDPTPLTNDVAPSCDVASFGSS